MENGRTSRGARTEAADAADPSALIVDHAAYPALFLSADASSANGQRTYRGLVEIELAFVLAGAMFGTLGAFVAGLRTVLASLATICLLGSMAMKFVNRSSDSTSRWFDGRAVAETVKTQTWRYMMRVEPYASDSSADRLFADDLMASMRARPDLRQSLADVPADARQITSTMRAIRALPFHERRDLYIRQRLSNQIAWYHGKAVRNARNARRWFWLSLIGQAAAAIIAFSSIFEPGIPLSSLVGFFAALATAATAWTQLGRHDELSKAYALAYQELIAIRTLAERITSQSALGQVVRDGEGAISREHTMWMAKREHGGAGSGTRPDVPPEPQPVITPTPTPARVRPRRTLGAGTGIGSAGTSSAGANNGPPVDAAGPPVDAAGPPVDAAGSPVDAAGSPVDAAGPPVDAAGPPVDAAGPPVDAAGPPVDAAGPPVDAAGPPVDAAGPPVDAAGPPVDAAGPPVDAAGPPVDAAPAAAVGAPVDLPNTAGGKPA